MVHIRARSPCFSRSWSSTSARWARRTRARSGLSAGGGADGHTRHEGTTRLNERGTGTRSRCGLWCSVKCFGDRIKTLRSNERRLDRFDLELVPSSIAIGSCSFAASRVHRSTSSSTYHDPASSFTISPARCPLSVCVSPFSHTSHARSPHVNMSDRAQTVHTLHTRRLVASSVVRAGVPPAALPSRGQCRD